MKYLKPFLASFVLAFGALASAQQMQVNLPNVAERSSIERSAIVFDDAIVIIFFDDGSVLI